MEAPLTTAEQLNKENRLLRAQVLNLLGKLETHANFVPRMVLDLASPLALEIEETLAGCLVRRKITHHNMGS